MSVLVNIPFTLKKHMYSVVVVYLFYKRHFDEVSESHLIMSDSLRPHGLYSPWGCKELDMTEQISLFFSV